MNAQKLTALEFANQHEKVIVRIAGNGFPGGQDFAWIPPETELPVSLEEIEGTVGEDGVFEADNLTAGPHAGDWKYSDWNGNVISAIWLRVDPSVWDKQVIEWIAASGSPDEEIRESCLDYGVSEKSFTP